MPVQTDIDVPLLDSSVPRDAYHQRAANGGPQTQHLRALLAGLEELFHPLASTATRTVWADISYYQQMVNDSYPEPVLAYRADNGSSTDPHARANHIWCARTPRLRVEIGYVVHLDGHENAVLTRLRNLYGATPPPKLAIMIDEESGSQFDGWGDHSAGCNKLAELLAEWLGSQKRVIAYANSYDYRSNWPGMVSWLKPRRVTASYGSAWPGTWAQQYYGGMNYPTPPGLPRAMKPFGTNVDLNVAYRSVAQIESDLGLTLSPLDPNWSDMASQVQVQAACAAAVRAELPAIASAVLNSDTIPVPEMHQAGNPTWSVRSALQYTLAFALDADQRVQALQSQLTAIKTELDAVKTKVGA